MARYCPQPGRSTLCFCPSASTLDRAFLTSTCLETVVVCAVADLGSLVHPVGESYEDDGARWYAGSGDAFGAAVLLAGGEVQLQLLGVVDLRVELRVHDGAGRDDGAHRDQQRQDRHHGRDAVAQLRGESGGAHHALAGRST